jgi:hypothetical protein
MAIRAAAQVAKVGDGRPLVGSTPPRDHHRRKADSNVPGLRNGRCYGRTSATIRRWETVGILPPAPIVEPGVSWQGDRRLYRRAHIEAAERIGQEERIVDAKVAAFRRSMFPARMRSAYAVIRSSGQR